MKSYIGFLTERDTSQPRQRRFSLVGCTITVCPYCSVELLEKGRTLWRCDNYHPEIMRWLEQEESRIRREQEEEEEAFWARRD